MGFVMEGGRKGGGQNAAFQSHVWLANHALSTTTVATRVNCARRGAWGAGGLPPGWGASKQQGEQDLGSSACLASLNKRMAGQISAGAPHGQAKIRVASLSPTMLLSLSCAGLA